MVNPSVQIDTRPEAMGDVPGVCELPLTRAVVQYRDVHEMDSPGGRIEDVGLALVVDGRFASSSEVVDLGSGQVKYLDLSTELVVLDWVYEPTLEHVAGLITRAATGQGPDELRRYAFKLGLRVLERVGFGPLSRPTFLRIGFRDICRDLDLHEGTSIRIAMGPGRLTRAHMDYDDCALVFRTALREPDTRLEHALLEAFPEAHLLRIVPDTETGSIEYRARHALPGSLGEARAALASIRRGITALVARYEPTRYRALDQIVDTFGARETLASLGLHEPAQRAVRVHAAASATVH